MSSTNSVRKLQILYLSKKNKKIKNLKNGEKNGPISAFIHTIHIEYPKELHENRNELLFLAERMNIGREEKLLANLQDKKEYAGQIKTLNQALKHGLKLKRYTRLLSFKTVNG